MLLKVIGVEILLTFLFNLPMFGLIMFNLCVFNLVCKTKVFIQFIVSLCPICLFFIQFSKSQVELGFGLIGKLFSICETYEATCSGTIESPRKLSI